MNDLSNQALCGCIKLQLFLTLVLFLPAGSVRFREAWVYWLLFSASVLLITLYFLKYDPRLIARRLKVGPSAEKEKRQKVIQAVAGVLAGALFIVPGFDHRWHWSAVPLRLVVAADALVVVSFVIIFLVFKENSYASSVIEVQADQPVIATGLYRRVRHPMYAGAVLLFVATPVALGSFWALLVAVALAGIVAARLLDEEQYLSRNLSGYREYCQQVRYRLLPLVW